MLAAGVLGTLELLFRSGLGGPQSASSCARTRRRSSARARRDATVDYSEGIAIGSSFHPNADTHIEPVRYPKGSNLMGALLDDPRRRRRLVPRPLRWLASALAPSAALARSHLVPAGRERTVILLVMQARDNSVRVRWTGRRLRDARDGARRRRRGSPRRTRRRASPPTCSAGCRARRSTKCCSAGRSPRTSSAARRSARRPTAACSTRGSASGRARAARRRRRRGHREPRRESVAHDRRAGGAGVRVLAERGEEDPRPPLGARYERIEPVAPRAPATRLLDDRPLAEHALALAQTRRSISYGMPARRTSTSALTARCRWGSFTPRLCNDIFVIASSTWQRSRDIPPVRVLRRRASSPGRRRASARRSSAPPGSGARSRARRRGCSRRASRTGERLEPPAPLDELEDRRVVVDAVRDVAAACERRDQQARDAEAALRAPRVASGATGGGTWSKKPPHSSNVTISSVRGQAGLRRRRCRSVDRKYSPARMSACGWSSSRARRGPCRRR